MEQTSTYRPIPNDRVYTFEHQPGTICGEDEVYGTVISNTESMVHIKWDDNKESDEDLKDQQIFPLDDNDYLDGSFY